MSELRNEILLRLAKLVAAGISRRASSTSSPSGRWGRRRRSSWRPLCWISAAVALLLGESSPI